MVFVGTGIPVGGAIPQLAFSSDDGELTVCVEELFTAIGGKLRTLAKCVRQLPH